MGKVSLRQIVNGLAIILTIVFNTISQIPSFGIGLGTNAEIANRYPDLLYFPANYAFSIWSIIYLGLIAYTIYQFLPAQRDNALLNKIGYLPALTAVFNIGWLLAFQYFQFPLSMVMMLGLLGTLIAIYIRLGTGRVSVTPAERWFIQIPFSIYLGWITAATVTNATYVLKDAGWNGFGIAPEVWTVIMLIVTGVVALGMIIRFHDIAYGLVIIWAVVAIYGRYPELATIATAALGVAAAVFLALVANVIINRFGSSLNRRATA